MQVKGVADGMGVGGRIKRTSLHWLQCVVVFSLLPLDKEGISNRYSCSPGQFEILKKGPTILKEVIDNYHSDSED